MFGVREERDTRRKIASASKIIKILLDVTVVVIWAWLQTGRGKKSIEPLGMGVRMGDRNRR